MWIAWVACWKEKSPWGEKVFKKYITTKDLDPEQRVREKKEANRRVTRHYTALDIDPELRGWEKSEMYKTC